jgi:hypothetical protein
VTDSVTLVPLEKLALQFAPQLIPAGEDVIVPAPVTEAVNWYDCASDEHGSPITLRITMQTNIEGANLSEVFIIRNERLRGSASANPAQHKTRLFPLVPPV